ncbi:MAG TPA: hypothetical protein VL634_12715 [Mycobacterium sp.]|nr:hypothetical protein [Mycobacterium sp.]
MLVESEPDVAVAGGGFWPLGMTMGVDLASPPLPLSLSLSEVDFSCGGQSTDVGGQLSALPDPDESPGGEQPAPAPKSPAVVQSALAMASGIRQASNEKATATSHIRAMVIS